ncbi:MAG: cytochrome c-type biogenesis protein CcmH [Ectothiorhodospiraceae bacterium]|nr:cytochrome c-type biogenesis protein CcmH [Ectothiorhodospiraceae bacterium]
MNALLRMTGLALALALGSAHGAAIEPVDFDSEAQHTRYRALLHELRCTVCQNESLAESNAELARDLRREVERMVRDDRSRDEILDFMVTRYGSFVLYKPPVNALTWALWGGPFVFALLGLFAWYRITRRASSTGGDFTATDRARAERLLDQGDDR